MGEIGDTPADGVKHFEGRYEFPGAVKADAEAPTAQPLQAPREALRIDAHSWRALGPGHHHVEMAHILRQSRSREIGDRRGCAQRCRATCCCHEAASIPIDPAGHDLLPWSIPIMCAAVWRKRRTPPRDSKAEVDHCRVGLAQLA